ncbi:MAG: cysteine--tRNA ligase [Promethearchaeota archaeon]|nr:MAG: cysteine--tRNA ligase [Candidatus Lokiarchaeota archaeon]
MKIYNSLRFEKEEFKTIHPKKVLMYVCGPTVYDSPHLGHAKSAVAFDIISRYFKFKGYNVKLVKNYTDIDDKIIQRANERGIDFKTLSDQYIKEYEEIMDMLNIQKDYKNPRATEVIDFMIDIIKGLISKDHAYESNGSVYFDVDSFPKYKTILQNISEEDLETEEEEEEEEYSQIYLDDKKNPKDFALWKKSKEDEPFWDSPWGKGRPGWHIECTAMAINFLDETIDIHGGGQDLKFPHHRNEISQSEAYTGKPFANYFMHNGFVNVDDEKMSKSLGNFFLVSDVAKEYDPMVIRLFLLSTHYRKSVNYSFDNMEQAKKNYFKLINTIQKINEAPSIKKDTKAMNELISKIEESESNLIQAMDDDFNTPIAIAEIMTLFREINRVILEENNTINLKFKDRFFKFVENLDQIFGIFPNLKEQLEGGLAIPKDEKDLLINSLLDLIKDIRNKLRKKKIYDISDEIREKLRELGINVEDN